MPRLVVLNSVPESTVKRIKEISTEYKDYELLIVKHEWLLQVTDTKTRTAALGVYEDREAVPKWISFLCFGGDHDDVLTIDDESLEMMFDFTLWDECEQEDEDIPITAEVPSQVTDAIYLSSYLAVEHRQRPSCVLSLIDREFTCDTDPSEGEHHHTICMRDSDEDPFELLCNIYESHNFIKKAIDSCGKVVVHCVAGVSRSSAIIASWLIANGMTLEDALEKMKISRPWIRPNPCFMEQLRAYEAVICKHPDKEILFAPGFQDIILNQTKRATTRMRSDGYLDKKAGDFVLAVIDAPKPEPIAILLIRDVQTMKASEISDDLARIENLSSAEELTNILKGFYPTLNKDSDMLVFHFDVVISLK
eukprot:TRINITY_DN3319_c3_g1_i1.p1 TRINITY_DN3319_c3_g1~~TRINITY_DN3319_c3_g1_i1.p1  ORF type:complete len:364 (+),score=52.14 TRINITY_DN3319_c3_g1_i1:53-1144(+)